MGEDGVGSIYFQGTDPIENRQVGGGQFIQLKDQEKVIVFFVTPMEKLVSVYEHFWQDPGSEESGKSYTCIREGCPMCQAGNKPRYVTMAVVYNIEEKKVQVLKMGIKFWKNQVEAFKAYGSANDRPYQIKRTGEGFNTSYHTISLEKSEMPKIEGEVPDLMELIKALSREELAAIVGGSRDNSGGGSQGNNELAPY